MYSRIFNPETNNWVSSTGTVGREIFRRYLNILVGGAQGSKGREYTIAKEIAFITKLFPDGLVSLLISPVDLTPQKTGVAEELHDIRRSAPPPQLACQLTMMELLFNEVHNFGRKSTLVEQRERDLIIAGVCGDLVGKTSHRFPTGVSKYRSALFVTTEMDPHKVERIQRNRTALMKDASSSIDCYRLKHPIFHNHFFAVKDGALVSTYYDDDDYTGSGGDIGAVRAIIASGTASNAEWFLAFGIGGDPPSDSGVPASIEIRTSHLGL